MAKRSSWALCAVLVSSGNLACAVLGNARTSAPPASPRPTEDPAAGMAMVHVKGGCFRMGNTFDAGGPEERPAHEVCVGDFQVGKYEVTQGQWKALMGSNPSNHGRCGDDCPVEMVSWNDVQLFVSILNGRSGGSSSGTYRLPTEAEWEYAARSGGKNERYSGGSEDVDGVAWYFGNSEEPHPVGRKAPNGLGIHDMTGNVWEWTNDWYGDTYYSSSPRDNPAGPSSGDRRVVRGGSFGTEAFDARASYRNYLPPHHRGGGLGFRLVKAAPAPGR